MPLASHGVMVSSVFLPRLSLPPPGLKKYKVFIKVTKAFALYFMPVKTSPPPFFPPFPPICFFPLDGTCCLSILFSRFLGNIRAFFPLGQITPLPEPLFSSSLRRPSIEISTSRLFFTRPTASMKGPFLVRGSESLLFLFFSPVPYFPQIFTKSSVINTLFFSEPSGRHKFLRFSVANLEVG